MVLILVMFFFVRFPNEYNSLYLNRKSGLTIWGLFSLYLVSHRFSFGHLINHSLTSKNLTIPPPYKLIVKSRATKWVRNSHYFYFSDLKCLFGGFRLFSIRCSSSLGFKFYLYLHCKWLCNSKPFFLCAMGCHGFHPMVLYKSENCWQLFGLEKNS